jgi:hypothetical protein
MAIVAAWGVLLAWIRWQGSLGGVLVVVSHSVIAWALCLIMAFAIARVFGPILRGSVVRGIVWGLLAVAILASLYLVWAHRRATYDFVYGLDHGFPYPDPAIIALLQWFDARYPASPGSLKMHGEFPRVSFVLGMLVLVFMSVTGGLAGVLSNRPEGSRSRDGLPAPPSL